MKNGARCVFRGLLACSLLAALVSSCSPESTSRPEAPAEAATAPPEAAANRAPAASPTPAPIRRDIQAVRLQIPSLQIDALVSESLTVHFSNRRPDPGCEHVRQPSEGTTLTVPNEGIATPVDNLEGLENKSWIFGHSRWQGRPGLFFRLQDLNIGDELFIDGIDRHSGAKLLQQRFIVESIFVADTESGGERLTAMTPEAIPAEPIVILQTSVRESGAGKQWILNRERLLAKADNLLEGSLDDPCYYLVVFVIARWRES